MSSPHYPYATIEKDGFQLALVEQGDVKRVLAAPLVSDEKRFDAKPGDMVKLIFEYRESMKARGSGQEFNAEHMWVEVVDYGDGCLIGRLDSSPQYTNILKSDDRVALHPKHIIAFWKDENGG
jgi:hypothetical protein